MDGKSLTPQKEKLAALRQVLPEVFAEGKVDWEKLKATLGEDINFANERYVLNWAGKSEAFKVLQTPTTKTLKPAKDESVNFEETEHIFIEGENLEVLKVLQKSYFGKVKMIYIDPPYNTGNDSFIYPDKFSETKADYEKRVGDKDEEGYLTKDGMFKKNSKENGQYHSNWLNMMMPRLYLAKNLLKDDGVIFISIDDNEVHNLRLLMNEIFGEENFLANLIWEKKYTVANDAKYFSDNHDHILVFSKKISEFQIGRLPRTDKMNSAYKNPDDHPKGVWKATPLQAKSGSKGGQFIHTFPNGVNWSPPRGRFPAYSHEKLDELYERNEIWFGKDGNSTPSRKTFLTELKNVGVVPRTILSYKEAGHNHESIQEIKTLFQTNLFTNPKPTKLIKLLSQIANLNDRSIVLDFFAGSGTCSHSIMALNEQDNGNRKCISVQLPERCEKNNEAFAAGYKTIADIAKERIRRACKKIQEENPDYNGDLGFKVLKLTDSNFKQWQQIKGKDAKALEEQMKMFVDPIAKNATTENMVYELLLKSGKDLNSKIEEKDGYYAINDNELALVLEKVNQKIIDMIIAIQPQKVIALDKLFKGNDQLKTNASLQMKDAGIAFKTI